MKFGIARKVNSISVSIIFGFGVLVGFYFINDQRKMLTSEMDERIHILISNLSHNLEFPVIIRDHEGIIRLLEGVLAQEDVVYARVMDAEGNVLYDRGLEQAEKVKEYRVSVTTRDTGDLAGEPLGFGTGQETEEQLGTVSLGVSLADLNRKLQRITYAVAAVIVIFIALAAIASTVLLRFMLARPISDLLQATKRISGGDLDYQVPVKTEDEIGMLGTSFNTMTVNLRDTMISRDYVDTIIDSMNDTLIAVDPEGKIDRVNRATEELLGYHESDLVGKPLDMIFHPDNPYFSGPPFQVLAQKGSVQNVELRFRSRAGSNIPVLFSSSVMFNKKSQMQGLVCVALDITERKRMEEELLRKTGELERSNEELEHFAYVASHDLQEPLRMVSSYLNLISRRYREKLDSDADEFISFAVDGSERMRRMINDLLVYSRVGTRKKEPEPVSVEGALRQSLSNLEMAVKDSGAEITHDPLPEVMGDELQLVQLFQNLIGNAIKFAREGERPAVHVSARRGAGAWTFSVKDNGIGIEPEYLDRIFQIFQRLHEVGKYPGTGIGLAVCKKIVERHGGQIWVESAPGQGTTFFFAIPTF